MTTKPKPKPKVVDKKAPVTTAPDWAAQYGVQAALIDTVPELKALFNKAVAQKQTVASFQSDLMNSTWFKTNGTSWRLAYATQKTDPGTWAEETKNATQQINDLAVQLGIKLTPDDVTQLANQSLFLSGGNANAINTSFLSQHIASLGKLSGQGGTTADSIASLKAHALNMGVDYSDDWYNNAAKSVASGLSTINEWTNDINTVAKSQFPSFAKQIDAGAKVSDLASPYIAKMSSLLELNPNDINLKDPTISKALNTPSTDASGTPTTQPLWQFEQQLKQDNRYFQTNQSHNDMADLASGISRMFGKI
jgi:hypothetical protein